MAVANRRSRKITVDGQRLRWWYRLPSCGFADCPQDWPHVLIAHESRTGTVITFSVEPGDTITPAKIADAVRSALTRGWLPGAGSGELHLAQLESG